MIVFIYSKSISENSESNIGIKIKGSCTDNLYILMLNPIDTSNVKFESQDIQIQQLREILKNIHHFKSLKYMDTVGYNIRYTRMTATGVNSTGNYLLQLLTDKCTENEEK